MIKLRKADESQRDRDELSRRPAARGSAETEE